MLATSLQDLVFKSYRRTQDRNSVPLQFRLISHTLSATILKVSMKCCLCAFLHTLIKRRNCLCKPVLYPLTSRLQNTKLISFRFFFSFLFARLGDEFVAAYEALFIRSIYFLVCWFSILLLVRAEETRNVHFPPANPQLFLSQFAVVLILL